MDTVHIASDPQRYVLGIAYQAGPDPRIKRGVDGGRDFFSKEALELACWSYMRSGCPQINAFHVDGTEDCAVPVESFIWRWDDWDAGDGIVVKDGDWLLGSILSPRMWQLHKDGKVNGLSPEGTARRRKVAKEGAVTIAKGAADVTDEEDEFTELTDATFSKIALVGSGANGVPRFLISKQDDAAGLLDAGFVRDLIGKQADEPDPEPRRRERNVMPNGVTITASPADLAAFLRKARQDEPDEVAKAKYSAEDKRAMLAAGHAIKNGNGDPAYPIGDKEDLGSAVHAVGRGGPDHDRIRAYVIRRAKALGASSEIPDNWAADGSLKEASVSKTGSTAVTKDIGPELDDGTGGMDPAVPLAEPDEMGPGDPTDPGSPAWESVDAATAQKWVSIAVRLKNALSVLAEREMVEAAGADPGDCENAWDLEDAMCAVDYVISTLAVFAAGEQAEADLCGEAMEAIGKAMSGFDPAPLDAIEGLCAVAKSGRVLSAVNEAHLREAHVRLNTVLSSLPSAPATDDGQPVAKTEGTTVTATATETEPVAKETARAGEAPDAPDETPAAAREVVKSASLLAPVYDQYRTLTGVTSPAKILQQVAKADDGDGKVTMQAVFDESGNLVGIVDPADITPVSGAGSKPADDSTEAPAPDADPDSMTPQPPAEAGTPADVTDDTVTKQDGTLTLTQDVLKSILADVFTSGLGAQPAQDIAKQGEVADLAAQVEKLMAEVEVLKEQPAVPKVFTAGAAPPDGAVPPPRAVLRGQDQDAQVNVTKAAEMRAQWTAEQDPAIANQRANAMQQRAIDGLSAIHGRA